MTALLRECAMCKYQFLNDEFFELICLCDVKHGVCQICFSHPLPLVPQKCGWPIMDGQHEIYKRKRGTHNPAVFESLFLKAMLMGGDPSAYAFAAPARPTPMMICLMAGRILKQLCFLLVGLYLLYQWKK
jgi:hypothetical protein